MFTQLAVHIAQIQAKRSKKKKTKEQEKKKTKQTGGVYPKLHQLLHYGDLLQRFGPLFRYSTHRYERKHIYSKSVARVMRNFINPAKSVHEKLAMNRALYDDSISFTEKNFWQKSQLNCQPNDGILTELPGERENYQKLRSKERPFRISSKVVRKIVSLDSNDVNQWFRTTKFYKHNTTGAVFCSGYVLQFESTDEGAIGKRLRRIEECLDLKYIDVQCLHYSSDFICNLPSTIDNSKLDCYIIEWIY